MGNYLYEKTKAIIFQIHEDNLEKEVVSANKVLATLLTQYIAEKSPDTVLAEYFLNQLSIKRNSGDLSQFFVKTQPVDDVSCFIHYLNKESDRILEGSDLAEVLGAFFSVYSYYRAKLNLDLQKYSV